MKHKHHIIPRHMGGTDDPSNLIELTVEEHAEAHRVLWEQHGNMKDYYAWKGLLSHIGKEKIRYELCKLGGKISGPRTVKVNFHSEESVRKRTATRKANPNGYNSPEQKRLSAERSQTPEAREKQKKRFVEICHAQGIKNSQYGTMWITNGSANKKIKKNDTIPDGWYKGRKMDS